MFKKWLICLFLIIYSFAFGYSEQVVVSQFSTGLAKSTSKNNYSLTGVKKSNSIRAINSTDLADVIDLDAGIIKGTFTGNEDDLQFADNTAEKSIAIPVIRNEGATVSTGKFQLTEMSTSTSGEKVINYLIEDTIKLPAKVITLSQGISTTGVKFTYDEGAAKAVHLSAYKKQEFIIRIAKKDINTDYDIIAQTNGIQYATENTNAKDFIEGTKNYVDFLVKGDLYDKEQSISTTTGLSLKFMPENIEVFGLPKGNYRIEVYSLRYSKDVTTSGNVVITKEDSKEFNVGNTEFLEEGIDIINFSSDDNFPVIKATILTIGTTTSPAITVSEDGKSYGGATIAATSGSIYTESSSSGAVTVNTGGTSDGNGKYYQLWEVSYTTTNQTINTDTRTVTYTMGSKSASTTYNLISSTASFASKPLYQTVFATFTGKTYGNGTYEIDDRTMNKYSDGYRNIRKLDNASGIGTLYKGVSGGESMSSSSYNWMGTSGRNSLAISKAISDSKGTFQEVGNISNAFTFYTTEWTPVLTYKESGASSHSDTANFSWNAPTKTSYDATLSEDKVIFRILKSGANAEANRYKPESNTNPIINSSSVNLTAFLNNSISYFDVEFTSGEDGKLSVGDSVFSFSKNNALQIVGLEPGDYQLQIYSLQAEDTEAQNDSTYNYKVLTYGQTTAFTMGLPVTETNEDFINSNNLYLIDSINVKSSVENDKPVKDVEVGIIIKAEEEIKALTASANLTAKKDEASTTNSALNLYTNNLVTEMWNNDSSKTGVIYNNIKAVVNPVLAKATKDDFKYPLDIVLLIDDSGSMQNEINSVTGSLEEFALMLEAKGFDVKFNLITFGSVQNNSTIGNNAVWKKFNSNYMAIFKEEWFADVTETKTALSKLTANGGYKDGQENGAWALHFGMDRLTQNGRYLNKSFQIVDKNASDTYLPSKKWMILLTDENMDTKDLVIPTTPTSSTTVTYNSANIVDDFANQLTNNDITLTGIYHTSVNTSNTSTINTYLNNVSGSTYNNNNKRVEFSDKLSNIGEIPADTGDKYYSEFALKGLGNKFNMYEMGSTGQYVSKALKDSISNIGITQRWNLTYRSPFPENDGKKREVIFALKGLTKISSVNATTGVTSSTNMDITSKVISGTRVYTVEEQKIDAYFINPDKDEKYLKKEDNNINLKAWATSQYSKVLDDGTTQLVNYPIIKGTFIITGNYSDDGVTVGTAVSKVVSSYDAGSEKVTLTKDVLNSKTGYYAESNLDAKTFTTKFGKKPMNVVVKFIAETAEESKTVTLSGVSVVEKDQPKVTSLTMTNVTLSDFMDDLKKSDGTSTFDSGRISGATVKNKSNDEGLTADDLNVTTTSSGMELNVKDGDKVKLEFTIDDESITSASTGVKVIYNNKPYVATYVGAVANTTKTNWKVELDSFVYKNGIDSISFDITDDSASPNTTAITADTFNQPELLANTTLIPSSNTYKYSNDYYDDGAIKAKKITDALAYLVVFDYNSSMADTGASIGTYPFSGTKKWISYSSNEFNFFEGKYTYNKTVYVMNSAGAIKSITHNSDKDALIINSGSIGNIITRINTNGSNFYVDKQAPSVTDFNFKKDSDPNLLDSSLLNNNSVASGILLGAMSSDRPYKEGDGISLNFNLKEVNFFKTVLSQVSGGDIVNNPIVTIGGTTATVDAITGLEGTTAVIDNKAYKKSGIAVDLTSGDSAKNSNMSLTVYDRAGNGTIKKFTAYYDDRIPNQISVVIQKTGTNGSNTYKYTKDVSIPLTKTGDNYSVGLMSTGGKYVGDLTTTAAINLVSFKTNDNVAYSAVVNNNNLLDLTSFSKSGKKGVLNSDAIVLDTEINDARSSITQTVYTYNSGSYVVNLTNTLKTIGELVGLKSYSISSSSNGARLQHGSDVPNSITESISAGDRLVDLDTQSLYRDTIGTTPYTSINNIILASSGNTKFKLILTDRLDNTKEIEYIVQIPNNVNIIGKKANSNKIINTKIDNSTKVIKIKSRTE